MAACRDDRCTMDEDRYIALQAAYSLLKTELRNVMRQADSSSRREVSLCSVLISGFSIDIGYWLLYQCLLLVALSMPLPCHIDCYG